MGYLRKDEVMGTLQEDRETTLACYNDEATRAVVKFCYDSIERELERLPQYEPENVVEQSKIYNVDKVIDQLEEETRDCREDVLNSLISWAISHGIDSTEAKYDFYMLLNNVEITSRCTEIAQIEENRNEYLLKKFLIAKK